MSDLLPFGPGMWRHGNRDVAEFAAWVVAARSSKKAQFLAVLDFVVDWRCGLLIFDGKVEAPPSPYILSLGTMFASIFFDIDIADMGVVAAGRRVPELDEECSDLNSDERACCDHSL